MDEKARNVIEALYDKRFTKEELEYKKRLWKVFIDSFLSRYIRPDDIVLDIGAGYCECINQVRARKKYIVDTHPSVKRYAHSDVQVIDGDIFSLTEHPERIEPLTCIFISNFFEHLIDIERNQIIQVLDFCHAKLRPGGSVIIIQPNYKYCAGEYYDFFDHHIPLTHLSLKEALEVTGFTVQVVIPRFLPYTTKGVRFPPSALRLYLALPPLWRMFGKQMFIKAVK